MMLQSGNNRPAVSRPCLQWSGGYWARGLLRCLPWSQSRQRGLGYRSLSVQRAGGDMPLDVSVQGATGIARGWHMSQQAQRW